MEYQLTYSYLSRRSIGSGDPLKSYFSFKLLLPFSFQQKKEKNNFVVTWFTADFADLLLINFVFILFAFSFPCFCNLFFLFFFIILFLWQLPYQTWASIWFYLSQYNILISHLSHFCQRTHKKVVDVKSLSSQNLSKILL